MKKITSVILALIMIIGCISLVGCSKKDTGDYNLVLITDGGAINDGAENESAWNGVKSYGDENFMTYRYYQPSLDENGKLTVDTIRKYIELAVNDKARFVILPGEAFAVGAYELAREFEDVNFILVDAYPHAENDNVMRFQSNVMCVSFNALQAGFLAGYCSVADGYTKLGYLGSVNADKSANYGAGFAQGAAVAADIKKTPVILDYANYDDQNLDYDYSFTVKATYKKVSDEKEKTYKVNVVNGLGSGVYTDGQNVAITANPPEKGKAFDHWETKSDTDGVRDRKVNISSKSKETMNLLVGDCDCTITAVYEDAKEEESKEAEENQNAQDNNLKFNVIVENGTGSGSYSAGETVKIVSDVPKDGYMFDKWVSVDNKGLKTGVSMENEYDYATEFVMVDRVASIAETMYDSGAQVIFGGGCPVSDSIFTATNSFDYQVWAYGSGVDESSKGNCVASVVNDYGAGIKLALAAYQPGGIVSAGCENGCIYVTGKSLEESTTDKKGNVVENKEYNDEYAMIYNALADGKLSPINMLPGGDISEIVSSACLTINYWVTE
jgi:basic membrane lipoprotein Med (substrate-binding protein (PBP1-ABC) superfamily)